MEANMNYIIRSLKPFRYFLTLSLILTALSLAMCTSPAQPQASFNFMLFIPWIIAGFGLIGYVSRVINKERAEWDV
jgi:FtsH-binding integral membrane protein